MDWDSTSYTDAPHCIRRFDTDMTVADKTGRGARTTGRSGARRCGRSGSATRSSASARRAWDTSLVQSQFSYAPDTSFAAGRPGDLPHGAAAVTARPPHALVKDRFAARGITF